MTKKVLVFLITYVFLTVNTYAQKSIDNSVQLSATVQKTAGIITLSWLPHANAANYYIYLKNKTNNTWTQLVTLPGSASQFIINNVATDSAYEFRVYKHAVSPDPTAQGYIYVGVNAPPIHHRGTLLLLVDSTYTDSCNTELTMLMDDISKDGWQVLRRDFGRNVNDVSIKNYIKSVYQSTPAPNAVLIVGHIAVPYSGDLAPDGHTPDHKGAWPADVFYADMDGVWTDNAVSNTGASRAANRNIPGDGKWDQDGIPGSTELQISRIDVSNMPLFSKTDIQLMKTYLNRAHQYKMGNVAVNKRGLIDDNFPTYDEAFAANGYRNFSPLVGTNNIATVDFISTLNTDFYQWAFGCGAGSYKKASGIGYTDSFVNNNTNAIFTILFGSYFGDWDNANNFLRAPLCSDVPALTSCWASRPNWFFHHMALGEHIGYSAYISQNNTGTYSPTGFFNTGVYVSLLGDLTLRTDYIKPPTNVTVTNTANGGASITWTASADPNVIGYYVYASNSQYGIYTKKSPMITGNAYIDSIGFDGGKWYMVRGVKLEETPSGSYNNLSLGGKDSAYINYPVLEIHKLNSLQSIVLYPNPVKDKLNLSINSLCAETINLSVVDVTGKLVLTNKAYTVEKGNNQLSIDTKSLTNGIYLLQIQNKNDIISRKWIKAN